LQPDLLARTAIVRPNSDSEAAIALNVVSDSFSYGALWGEPDYLVHRLPVFEDHYCRDASYVEAHWNPRVIIDIHLCEQDPASEFLRQFIHDRGDFEAWRTPGCPEIHDDRSVVRDRLIKVIVSEILLFTRLVLLLSQFFSLLPPKRPC
jgi:hypothetical protein